MSHPEPLTSPTNVPAVPDLGPNGNLIKKPEFKCSVCDSVSITRCGNCLKSAYCSKECQKTDWKKGHKSVCVPLEIKWDPLERRQRVYLTKSFKAGQTIWNETPLAIAPVNSQNYEKHLKRSIIFCIVCCVELEPSNQKKCTKCGIVMCGSIKCAEVIIFQFACFKI